MSNLTRMITQDGSAVVCAINATDIVSQIEQIHHTSAVVTAALGRLTAAASMMGYSLKNDDDRLTLKLNGNGPTGSLIAVADSHGDVKSYVSNPIVELPLNPYGKLDVAGAVGKDGTLCVIKDVGLKEPYVGQIAIVSGEIAEDITQYFATSEQTPTVCGLGVLVNPDLTVQAAGGYLLQLLPFCEDSIIDRLEENLKKMPSVSTMFADGWSTQQVCEKLLDGMNPNILDEGSTSYHCDCSRERIKRALVSIGLEELTSLRDEQDSAEIVCHFCNRKYTFSKQELTDLIDAATA